MTVFEQKLYWFAGYISENIWGRLSGSVQLGLSRLISKFYNTRISRWMIRPYCWIHYRDSYHYLHFVPGNGQQEYTTFQDFFTREFPRPKAIKAKSVWPCEGYLCESSKISETSTVCVKGETRHIETIFGKERQEIDGNAHFSNVFLHNNNYHHIHAPTNGKVTRIQHIPGELLLLRPWAYRDRPSVPALTNERINVDIEDAQGRSWLLSIVGGPLVATIKLPDWFKLGAQVSIGQKIASFELGSTCCMISPLSPTAPLHDMIEMGEPFNWRAELAESQKIKKQPRPAHATL